jgi:anthranilate synthase component 1
MKPSFEEFRVLAGKGNLIPVFKEIIGDVETPVSAYMKLARKPSFLLESVVGGEKWARYSFLGIDPSITITCRGRTAEIREGAAVSSIETIDPLNVVKDILSRFRPVEVKGVPRFYGGFVGYIGYDTVKFFEKIPDLSKPSLGMPDVFLILADTLLIFDNLKQTIKVLFNVHTEGKDLREAYTEAEDRIAAIIGELKQGTVLQGRISTRKKEDVSPEAAFSSNFRKEDFLGAVTAAKEFIKAGDIFQVVMSQRFEKPSDTPPFEIYRTLRVINPSPYMYYLDTGEAQIIGSSPEILVRVEGDRITLRPIAGTRRRGETEEQDLALEEELKKDPKEIAEHVMLVDLGRNDVGRVAEVGSVKVSDFLTVERYSHVMHLVSNVEGKLAEGLDAFDVLRACFPAGTVSGAPKVRAMEIIEELEPAKRGPYAGSVGYFGYSGNMDTCITIRTLVVKDGIVYVQAGAGLVADSVPESEYAETVNKAMAMMKAVEGHERIFG